MLHPTLPFLKIDHDCQVIDFTQDILAELRLQVAISALISRILSCSDSVRQLRP